MRNGGKSAALEFLPAAIEVRETPPSAVGRAILWVIMIFFLCAGVWAAVGQVDIVAVAKGKIVPTGQVKSIQPLGSGIVRVIHVRDGQRVFRGDVLIELDDTSVAADIARLEAERLGATSDLQRLSRLLEALLVSSAEPPETRIADDLTVRRIRSDWSEFASQARGVDKDIQQKRLERAAVAEHIEQLDATIPLVTERAASLQRLLGKQFAARADWLAAEERRIEQVKGRDTETRQLAAIDAAIEALGARRENLSDNIRSRWLREMEETRTRLAVLEEELVKARERAAQLHLTSPVAGFVKQLAVHTIGGVVTPAQELMQIVPENGALEVEAWILNKDIGFVSPNQEAEIKVDAFPFTRFGTIQGHVAGLSADAVATQEGGLLYAAKVVLAREDMLVNGRRVNLAPGMSVAVEVKTGRRRVVEFVLSPLLRYGNESLRER